MNSKPKISVITVCRNVADVIGATLFSVSEQTYKDIEYIVVDGASTDGTKEIIERSGAADCLISEPDSGIYEAMNKGIRRSSGDYCLFLNAGDLFCHATAVANAVAAMSAFSPADVFYGNQLMYHQHSGRAHIWRPKKRSALDFYSGSLPHASSFIRRDAFERIGLYDESYRIAGDYEWFVRAFRRGMVFRHIDCLVGVFIEGEGISTNKAGHELQEEEKRRLRSLHFDKQSLLKIAFFLRKNKIL